MAVYIVEGKIGSGKTYYCVSHILKKYYYYDDLIKEYVSKQPCIIITNIDSLRLEHVDLQHEIDTLGLNVVFSESYVNKMRDSMRARTVLYLIDEAQSFFDRKYYDKDVFFFFQFSRHYGVDIYLITQDVESLAKELRNLSEYYIHAVSRTFGTGLTFRYKYIANNEVISTVTLKKDKRIFSVYRSFIFDEIEKPKPVYTRYILMFFILVAVVLVGYRFFYLSMWKKGAPKNVAKSSSVSPKTPVSRPLSSPNLSKSRAVVVEHPVPVSSSSRSTSFDGSKATGVVVDLALSKSYYLFEDSTGAFKVVSVDAIDPRYSGRENVWEGNIVTDNLIKSYEIALKTHCEDNPQSANCSFFSATSSGMPQASSLEGAQRQPRPGGDLIFNTVNSDTVRKNPSTQAHSYTRTRAYKPSNISKQAGK